MLRHSVTSCLLISAFLAQLSFGAINDPDVDVDKLRNAPADINTIKGSETENKESHNVNAAQVDNLPNSSEGKSENLTETDKDKDTQTISTNAINSFARKLNQDIFQTSINKSGGGDSGKIGSVIWSPFSVYQALVPLYYGADGDTRKELGDLLLPNYSGNEKDDNNSITFTTDLEEDLSKSNKPLSSATGLFTRSGLQLNGEYVGVLEKNVKNVELKEIEFSNVTSAVTSINSWVQDKTHGIIKEAVDEGQIDQNIFLMIVNCVRFKAPWQTKFNPKLTKIADFNGISGTQKVQMMHKAGNQYYGEFPRKRWLRKKDVAVPKEIKPFSALEMSYKGTDLVGLFILPNSTNDIQDTMRYVEEIGVERITKEMSPVEVNLSMPKFRLGSDVDVVDALENNGLKTPFNPSMANLTRIFAPANATVKENNPASKNSRNLDDLPMPYLSKIVHRTIFETSEEGTSAGAVTALSIVPLSALGNQRSVEFNLNRPFIVMLVKNGTILFQGIVADLIGQDLDGKTSSPAEALETATRNNLSSEGEENVLNSNEKLDNATTDDRSWWRRKGVPGYLKLNLTEDTQAQTPTPKEEIANISEPAEVIAPNQASSASLDSDIAPSQAPPPSLGSAPPSSSPSLPPNTFIQFNKYQQPEPKHPDGIRFPATYPFHKNKPGHIRPRNQDYYNYHRRNVLRY